MFQSLKGLQISQQEISTMFHLLLEFFYYPFRHVKTPIMLSHKIFILVGGGGQYNLDSWFDLKLIVAYTIIFWNSFRFEAHFRHSISSWLDKLSKDLAELSPSLYFSNFPLGMWRHQLCLIWYVVELWPYWYLHMPKVQSCTAYTKYCIIGFFSCLNKNYPNSV